MNNKLLFCLALSMINLSCRNNTENSGTSGLRISENHRYFITTNGDPFFWLGDTGWLLFTKLTREEAGIYFEDRKQKGFNVIQVMVLHNILSSANIYGDSAIIDHCIDKPNINTGSSPYDPDQYDFWDHADYLIDLAATKGLYIALVPLWGSNIKYKSVSRESVRKYITWLAERYKGKHNIIWLNGGDINGSDSTDIWNMTGSLLKQMTPEKLVTFHPRGRTKSSTWFHNEKWLDFNMFQSGHRRYDQDTSGLCYGEDNWKYVNDDYAGIPVKPTLDGEPSYENIPQGLHDTNQPVWKDNDVRRYAYWSVFAGACGFTYGNNSVMQFHKAGDTDAAYGVKDSWENELNAPGACQMKYLKNLILSKPYFDRRPFQEIISGETGDKYDHLVATKGKGFVLIYTWNGRKMDLNLDLVESKGVKASWFNPRTGLLSEAGEYLNKGIIEFDPPGEQENGNDWVLVLDSI